MTRATSYAAPTIGANGLLGDDNPAFTISRAVETSAGIGFGCVVGRGTDRNKQVTIGGSTPIGIVCRTRDTQSQAETVLLYEEAKIVRCGFVYLYLATSGNAGSPLCYNTTTGIADAGSPGGGQLAFAGELMEDAAGSDVQLCWVDFTASLDVETRLAAAELAVGTTLPAVDAGFTALFAGMGAAVGFSPSCVKFNDLDMKADESEKTGVLPGTGTSRFIPSGIFVRCVTGSGSPDGDGTINIGTSTGGVQVVSGFACTGITAAGTCRYIPMAALACIIAGNATLYCNVESPDGDAGTCVYDVYLMGWQVGA